MDKKVISFRCPSELVNELDSICTENYMERSNAIVIALHQFTHQLADMGLVEPILEADIHREEAQNARDKAARAASKASRKKRPKSAPSEESPLSSSKKS